MKRNTFDVVRNTVRMLLTLCALWFIAELTMLFTAPAARADNCGTFADCFGVANSASEAGFGLMMLTALSMILNFVPIVGDVKGVVEAISGRDLLTGEQLEPWERVAGLFPLIPAADLLRSLRSLDDLARLGVHTDDLVRMGVNTDDLARLGMNADDLAHLGGVLPGASRADNLAGGIGDVTPPRTPPRTPPLTPPRTRPGAGTTYDLPPSARRLVDEYADPATTTSRRTQLSEQIGEEGALRHLQDVTGNDALTVLRPASDADVADYADLFANGQPWPNAVAFGGRNATNVVYFDGQTMHILEAKGGSSSYGDRWSSVVDPGNRIEQTDPRYPLDVANDMSRSSKTDGRNTIGDLIADAYKGNDQVRYVGVRTGTYNDLLRGSPSVTVMDVFLEPPPIP